MRVTNKRYNRSYLYKYRNYLFDTACKSLYFCRKVIIPPCRIPCVLSDCKSDRTEKIFRFMLKNVNYCRHINLECIFGR